MVQFDDILKYLLGEFGTYQIRIFLLVAMIPICVSYFTMMPVFTFATTDVWCKVPNVDEISQSVCLTNFTTADCMALVKDITIPTETTNLGCGEMTTFSRCQRYEFNLSEVISYTPGRDMTFHQNATKVSCDQGWEYDRSKYTSTVIDEFDLVCDDSYKTALAKSCYMAGVLVGSVLYGIIADRFGRLKALVVGVVIATLAGTVEAFAPSFAVFAFCRFLVAVNGFGVYIVGFVIVTEFVGPSKRTLCGMVYTMYWSIGYMLLPLFAYFIRTWWVLQLVLTIPFILFVSYWWLVPESPRWLLSVGKSREALKIINKMAKVNKVTLPEDIFSESWKPVNKDDVIQKADDEERQRNFLLLDMFKLPNMRKKTIILAYVWIANTLVYYGLSFSTSSLGGDDFINCFIAGAVEIPAYIMGIFIPDWRVLGRRGSLIVTMVIGGIACIAASFVPPCGDYIWIGVTVTMISKFCITCSFGIVYVYTAELFPTPVRSMAVGVSSMFARIGGIIAPQLLLMATLWENLPAFVFGITAIVAGLLIIPLPETRGKQLPETIEEGEQFGKKKGRIVGNGRPKSGQIYKVKDGGTEELKMSV